MLTTVPTTPGATESGEGLFQSIAATATDAIVLTDARGGIMFWNRAAQALFGYDEREVLGREVHDLLAPKRYRAAIAAALRNFQQSGQGNAVGKTVELMARRKNGAEFPIELSLSAVQRGGAWHAVGVLRDITERKQMAEELRRYRSAFDITEDGVFILDRETMRVLDANDAACREFGYPREELLNLTLPDLQPRSAARKSTQELTETLATEGDQACFIAMYRRKDGTELPIEIKLQGGSRGGQNVIVAVARNITGQAANEAAAKETKQRLQAIWDAVSAGVMLIDQQTRHIADANPAALNMIGATKEQVVGRVCHGLVCPNPPGGCPVCDGGHVMEGAEVVLLTSQGCKTPILKTAVPVILNGHKYILESFVDITERMRAEETLARHQEMLEELVQERSKKLLEAQRQVLQGEKLASVGRLAAGIAHEINTPIQYVGDNLHALSDFLQDLQAVVAKYREGVDRLATANASPEFVDMAKAAEKEHDLDFILEDAPKAVLQALEGVQRVAQIVRAMKDFSHMKGGSSSNIDLNRCLESTLTVARNEYKYHADVQKNFGELPPASCYPSELNQVFLNLLINAAHAIQDTGRRGLITVTTRADGDWIEISIADTGAGIPEDIREKIYEPFFTTKGIGKGTGQGLFIARQVVEGKHKGTLTCESEVGKGTTFRIRIPVKLAKTDDCEEGPTDGQDSNPVCG